ncbi:hypothetical protein T439DRAFT_358028 [Meredithblackwellia eburnea MCA 4105]
MRTAIIALAFLASSLRVNGALTYYLSTSDTKNPFVNSGFTPTAAIAKYTGPNPIEITDYSLSIEQTLNIGSTTGGAGAGKVTFNPFTISKSVDSNTPTFFKMAAQGTTFQNLVLSVFKSSGNAAATFPVFQFKFTLVAVQTQSFAYAETTPSETLTFAYGGLAEVFTPTTSAGTAGTIAGAGWNRVKNVSLDPNATSLTRRAHTSRLDEQPDEE